LVFITLLLFLSHGLSVGRLKRCGCLVSRHAVCELVTYCVVSDFVNCVCFASNMYILLYRCNVSNTLTLYLSRLVVTGRQGQEPGTHPQAHEGVPDLYGGPGHHYPLRRRRLGCRQGCVTCGITGLLEYCAVVVPLELAVVVGRFIFPGCRLNGAPLIFSDIP